MKNVELGVAYPAAIRIRNADLMIDSKDERLVA